MAVTLNTNDFGDVRTMALLAQVASVKLAMDASAVETNANLAVVSGTQYEKTGEYLHGACVADFAVVCGNLPGVTMWSPIQSECDVGTLANNIDQTMVMDQVYVNRIEFNYSTGAEATENYTAETDNKMWLLNDAKFVNYQHFTLASGVPSVTLTVSGTIPALSDGSLAFLRNDEDGFRGVTFYDTSLNTAVVYRVEPGNSAEATYFVYDSATYDLYFPTSLIQGPGDILEVIFAADNYNGETHNVYFTALDEASRYPIGALRQGQIEIYVVAPSDVSWSTTWRLTSSVVTADLTREPLAELGHLSPYDRPLTLPVPLTVTTESIAGDLEHWALFTDKLGGFDLNTIDDMDLADLMRTDYLKLVIKVYAQTDEEAGGVGEARKVLAGSDLIGKEYQYNGTVGTYALNNMECPLKTIIVDNLKVTEEAYNLDQGANATQTFNFKANNDLFVVKGGFDIAYITGGFAIRRNA